MDDHVQSPSKCVVFGFHETVLRKGIRSLGDKISVLSFDPISSLPIFGGVRN